MNNTLEKKTDHATTGLIVALAGLGQIVVFLILSVLMLFFSPMLMCGSTLFSVPFSIGAVVFGWKGREESPKKAWAAILIGLSLVPLSLFLAKYFGDLIFEATA